jgi:hypothetical protein
MSPASMSEIQNKCRVVGRTQLGIEKRGSCEGFLSFPLHLRPSLRTIAKRKGVGLRIRDGVHARLDSRGSVHVSGGERQY